MPPGPRFPLYYRILIGLVVGLVLVLGANILFPGDERVLWLVRNVATPVGQVFLRLIFMVVIPLVFCALALGMTEVGDLRGPGRLGGRTLLFTAVISGVSVVIGIGLANLLQPGTSESATSGPARLARGGPRGILAKRCFPPVLATGLATPVAHSIGRR